MQRVPTPLGRLALLEHLLDRLVGFLGSAELPPELVERVTVRGQITQGLPVRVSVLPLRLLRLLFRGDSSVAGEVLQGCVTEECTGPCGQFPSHLGWSGDCPNICGGRVEHTTIRRLGVQS